MSVMSGFEETLRDRLLGINAHIALVKSGDQLRDYENLLRQVVKQNGVVAASPTIYGQVMLTSGSRVSGVVVRGVDPDRVNGVVNLQSFLKEGNLAGLKSQHPIQVEDRTVLLPGIILGERLANQLGVFPGSPVQVVSPLGQPDGNRGHSQGAALRRYRRLENRDERDRFEPGVHGLDRSAKILRARQRGDEY